MTVASTSPWPNSSTFYGVADQYHRVQGPRQALGLADLPNWHVLRYRAASPQGIEIYLAEDTARAGSLKQARRHQIHPGFLVLHRRTQIAVREPPRGPTGATSRPRAP
jgi:hypothetical protein